MLTESYLKNLHLLHNWQVIAVLFYNAKIEKKKEHYKSYVVSLPKNIAHFPSYQDEDLWDILFTNSDFLSWKKFKLKNHQISIDQAEHLKDIYHKYISNMVKDFNTRSGKQLQFNKQINNYPEPRIARYLPAKDPSDKNIIIAKHIETPQESILASAYWERNYKISIEQYIDTRTCIAYSLPDPQRDALLDTGKMVKERLKSNGVLNLKLIFPDILSLKQDELKKVS